MLKITNSVQGLAFTASSVVLGLGIVGSTSAIASDDVFWDVEFFDESGVVVGNGEFSYDPTTTTFVNTTPDLLSIPPEGFEVQTAILTASFNVFGQEVFPATEILWWFESDRDPAQQFNDSWLFIHNSFSSSTAILSMDNFELISDTLGSGDWNLAGFDFTIGEDLSGSGQWSAALRSQTVPEPTATLSLFAFSAVGIGSRLKRKNQST